MFIAVDKKKKNGRGKERRKTYIPKRDDRRVVIIIQPSIVRMVAQVIKVDWRIHTSDQDLHFLLVEHPTAVRNRDTKKIVSTRRGIINEQTRTESTLNRSSRSTLQKRHYSEA